MEFFGVFRVALAGDDGEGVGLESADALAGLVDAEAEAAPEGLAALGLGVHVAQGADLEDVGIVPAFAEGGVGENELEGGVEAEEFFLFLHDEVVGAAFDVFLAG